MRSDKWMVDRQIDRSNNTIVLHMNAIYFDSSNN